MKIPARIFSRERRGGVTHKKEKSNGELSPAGRESGGKAVQTELARTRR